MEKMDLETLTSKPKPSGSGKGLITLTKAIEFGEYDPEYLANFAEWHELSRHAQYQLIHQALTNRRRHLLVQWAEINNQLDFSKKPHLRQALKNIQKQLEKLRDNEEKLQVEYSV